MDQNVRPIKRLGEIAYILSIVLCSLGVSLSAKSGMGVSTVVSPAYVLSSYLVKIDPFFSFGNVEYIVQGVVLILLALFMHRITLSYPLSFVTAFLYGMLLNMWQTIIGTDVAEEWTWKILYMVLGAVITSFAIALCLRSYLPQQGYDFAVKEISVVKKFNLNKVKWIYDISSLAVAIVIMLILFGTFDFSLIGIGTLILAAVNAPLIALFGKIFDSFIDFSPLLPTFAKKVFKYEEEVKEEKTTVRETEEES